jgi:hypothetical protein
MAPPPVRLACRDAAENRPARSSDPCHVFRAPPTTAGRSLVAPASALRAAHRALFWLCSSLVAWRHRSRRVWRRPDVASVLVRSFRLFFSRLSSGVGTRGAAGSISPRACRPRCGPFAAWAAESRRRATPQTRPSSRRWTTARCSTAACCPCTDGSAAAATRAASPRSPAPADRRAQQERTREKCALHVAVSCVRARLRGRSRTGHGDGLGAVDGRVDETPSK